MPKYTKLYDLLTRIGEAAIIEDPKMLDKFNRLFSEEYDSVFKKENGSRSDHKEDSLEDLFEMARNSFNNYGFIPTSLSLSAYTAILAMEKIEKHPDFEY